MKATIATVRRMATNLEVAQKIEAGEHADKWSVGEKQVVISIVEGKPPWRFPAFDQVDNAASPA